MIGVLVVEDSRVTRDYLVSLIEADPELRVVATAVDGETALQSVVEHRPHVVLMDLHLPGIDGIETTRRIMASTPVPVVVCTADDGFRQVQGAMAALDAGALALLVKPQGPADPGAEASAAAIVETLKLMAEIKLVRRWTHTSPASPASPGATHRGAAGSPGTHRGDVAAVAIGASTGGPPVIAQILASLARPFPAPILIVQHISPGFTQGFAEWLTTVSGMPVHVAQGGETPLPGHAYLAPDHAHLRVGPRGDLETTQDEPVGGLRPSVAVLFRSVAERFGRRAIGVLLTGMGRDGADELRLMADRGALTVAQDEATCVVFGMPREAIKLGAARYVLPPERIAAMLDASARGGTSDV